MRPSSIHLTLTLTLAFVTSLAVGACSDENNRGSPTFEIPGSITRGPIKLSYMTAEFEERFDRKKDEVCTFTAGAGDLLIVYDQQGVATINEKRIELAASGNAAELAVLSGSGYTLTVSEGSLLERRLAKEVASLAVKGPEGEATFSPGVWICFPLE